MFEMFLSLKLNVKWVVVFLMVIGLISPGSHADDMVGKAFRDCAVCPEMVVVPPGSFKMGSNDSDYDYDTEQPVHKVTPAHPLAVGKYEITFSQWDACMSEGGCSQNPFDFWGRGNRPVIFVNWNDVQEYVRWLGRKTGQRYRLLSEAEWEYVARAGTQTEYHTGDRITTDQANFKGDVYREQTVPVGRLPANDFGLHDVHGNVTEWVEDCYHKRYDGAPTNGSAWTTGECRNRVVRGGSWTNLPEALRSAYRFGFSGGRYGNLGFRVARTLTP